MINNEHKDTLEELKKIRARRKARPMTYMEKQYARAEEKANKIKNHNEKLLKHLKEKHND
jgi:hypothetical protein